MDNQNDEIFALTKDAMLTWEEISKENEPWFKEKVVFHLPQPHITTKAGIELNAITYLKIDGHIIPQYMHVDPNKEHTFIALSPNITEYFRNLIKTKS